MKLSEAIRLGIPKGGKQIKGYYFDFDDSGNVIGSCAFGAAKLGFGYEAVKDNYFFANVKLEDQKIIENTPGWVMEYNDKHGFTREEIADKLEAAGF